MINSDSCGFDSVSKNGTQRLSVLFYHHDQQQKADTEGLIL